MTNHIVSLVQQPTPDQRRQDNQFAQDSLANLERVLEVLPLERLAEPLQQLRRRGRNDYPPQAIRSALIARIVLGYDTITELVKALRCNPYLMRLCGFEIERQLVTRRRLAVCHYLTHDTKQPRQFNRLCTIRLILSEFVLRTCIVQGVRKCDWFGSGLTGEAVKPGQSTADCSGARGKVAVPASGLSMH